MMLLASLAVAVAVGWVLVRLCWAGDTGLEPILTASLAVIVGLGATSGLFFVASLVPGGQTAAPLIEVAALVALMGWNLRRTPAGPARSGIPRRLTTLDWVLATGFCQICAVAAIVAWRAYRAEPYGGWDGWAIWNLHARFLHRGGPEWPQLLGAPALSWTHPDYPWLVPASVARLWAWAGENAAASAWVSALFAIATIGLLVGLVRRLRHLTAALVAGLLLVGTPFFVTFSTNQHADIPLAAYMLATVGLLALGGQGVLAALCGVFAAWTKNEGLLFLVVATAAQVFRARSTGWRTVRPYVVTIVLGLAPLVVFKLVLAPPGDLVATPLRPRLGQLFMVQRHSTILAALWRDVRGFGEWHWLPYLGMLAPFAAWRAGRRLVENERVIPPIVGLVAIGYYAVYLLTPQNLAWHLDTSLVRLLLQLWPMALLAWALVVPLPAVVATPSTAPRWTAVVFVLANVLAALACGYGLARQPAPNELALALRAHRAVAVAVGDGWYAVEQAARERWAWCRGDARLVVNARAVGGTTATLRFKLRSLGVRHVTVTSGATIVWQGDVGDAYLPVVIPGLHLPDGASTLVFTTDRPGVAEAATGGARELAFAIYDLTID